jgi:conserved hypothetical integral membrane protein
MSRRFTLLAAVFCVCLVASNLFETKIFDAGLITLTGGFLIFPISYIINDCLTEVYGYKNARFVILTGFALNLLFVLAAQIIRLLPPESFWDGQEHFDYVFKADMRITAASMLAFITGSILNAKVMAKMKAKQGEKGFGWRAIASTLVGEGADSIIFFPIAFWGVGAVNMIKMMAAQIVLKTIYEIIVLPVTRAVVRDLKKKESGYLPDSR